MRLLDRYLLRDLLVPLAYCLGGFLICWLSFDLFIELGDLQEKKLMAGDIAELYMVKAPAVLVLLLPVALLLAMLYALTNHARHNEITAIRAAGISLWRVAAPYFAVGFAATIVLFVLNEIFVPETEEAAEQIKRRRTLPPGALPRHKIRNFGFTNSRDGRVWQVGLYNSETGEMLNPQVIWAKPDGSRTWIRAERAVYTQRGWTFYNVRQFLEEPKTNALLVPLIQTNLVRFPMFTETPEQIRSEIRISHTITLRAARKADIPVTAILHYLRLHPAPTRSDAWWLHTKLHGRLAAPWTCLVVVLIALPFGAASGRRNVFVGVAVSIVICFAFFVLQQFGLALGTGGYLPPWLAAWFPNIAFGLAGLLLMVRVR